jgi:hypothetical protein
MHILSLEDAYNNLLAILKLDYLLIIPEGILIHMFQLRVKENRQWGE